MHGSMYHCCSIISNAKRALSDGSQFPEVLNNFEMQFVFLRREPQDECHIADNTADWFKKACEYGLINVKLCAPLSVKDRYFVGDTEHDKIAMICEYSNGETTKFDCEWKYDFEKQKWMISYLESLYSCELMQSLCFTNNRADFKRSLKDISGFAKRINSDGFAELFDSIADILSDGDYTYPPSVTAEISLPEDNLRMYVAASMAENVFGGMMSWNDTPKETASAMGFAKEYEERSCDLFKNVRLATLYAINEW